MDDTKAGFRQTLSELLWRLERLEPATNQKSAHEQIAETLNAIEDRSRGTAYEQDLKVLGTERMILWDLNASYRWRLENDPAYIELEGGYQVDLYLDGSIRIARDRNGTFETLLFKKGG